MDYFKKQLELLKLERDEDKRSYIHLTENTSVSERRANGLAWYPIAIRGTEMSRGDYLTVEIERTTHHDLSYQLKAGVPAALFSNHDPKKNRIEGTISHLNGNRLKITLRTDELPDWSRDGKLGIDLLFDDNSYDEMKSALVEAGSMEEKDERKRLLEVLTGAREPSFNDSSTPFNIAGLNSSQREAVAKIVNAQELAVVHGPPGTGKTTTLVQAVKALVKNSSQKILVVAPSNAAVDLLSEKLSESGLEVLRVGNPSRVSDALQSLTLNAKMGEHNRLKEIKNLRKQANEFRNMAHKYKRQFGKSERDQRKALFDEAHRILKEVNQLEQYITDDVVAKSQVITATPVGSNHYTVRNIKYDTVVIDEAGQALEPACWISILKGRKVVLAGDHFQLPPTIKSAEAAERGLANTLLEKMAGRYPEAVVLLEEQYRMNETIMGFSSQIFYGNRLKANEKVANRSIFPSDYPLQFVDTAGCGFEEKREGTSTYNSEEAAFLFKHLESWVDELKGENPQLNLESFPTIAIIAPYKEQIVVLKDQLEHVSSLKDFSAKIAVNTVDSFQGQERDVVYLSMTRSNDSGEIGFLSDTRRMNVAMTRARKKLVVIGDSATISNFPFYNDFINYAENKGSYKSAWEFLN